MVSVAQIQFHLFSYRLAVAGLRECLAKRLAACRAVAPDRTVPERDAPQLFNGGPGEVQRGAIGFQHATFEIQEFLQLIGAVEAGPESTLTGLERFIGPFAFGDVRADTEHSQRNAAGRPFDDSASIDHPMPAT